jgi:hypothetical protein
MGNLFEVYEALCIFLITLPSGRKWFDSHNCAREFSLVQRIRGDIPPMHSNQLRYLLYCSTEKIWPAPVPGFSSRRLPSVPAVTIPLKPRENFMYLKFGYSIMNWVKPNELLFPRPFLKSWIRKIILSKWFYLPIDAQENCFKRILTFTLNSCFNVNCNIL